MNNIDFCKNQIFNENKIISRAEINIRFGVLCERIVTFFKNLSFEIMKNRVFIAKVIVVGGIASCIFLEIIHRMNNKKEEPIHKGIEVSPKKTTVNESMVKSKTKVQEIISKQEIKVPQEVETAPQNTMETQGTKKTQGQETSQNETDNSVIKTNP